MSHRRSYAAPPAWNDAVLELGRRQAIANFIAARNAEGGAQYRSAFAANVAMVAELFATTGDLLHFSAGTALAAHPRLIRAARYLGAPPVSADDLDTLAEARIATRKRLDADLGEKAAKVIAATLDRERFPWLFATPRRAPTDTERATALRWTAGLMTVQEVQTGRRGESSARQEETVERVLLDQGFAKVAPRPIEVSGGLEPGQFCRETHVAGTKCDIPIGLRDGRFLFVECKVSNSATNSVKRLNRECGGKAAHWRSVFGDRAVSAAVLAGVFKLKNLQDAQAVSRLTLLWEHDLDPLADFLQAAA